MKTTTLFLAFILCIQSNTIKAQATVTFQINLKPLLADSTIIPGLDHIELQGNLHPFRRGQNIVMTDMEPVDSVYTAEVRFRRSQSGQTLQYNFIIRRLDRQDIRESRPRVIQITTGDVVLDPLYFNAYSW